SRNSATTASRVATNWCWRETCSRERGCDLGPEQFEGVLCPRTLSHRPVRNDELVDPGIAVGRDLLDDLRPRPDDHRPNRIRAPKASQPGLVVAQVHERLRRPPDRRRVASDLVAALFEHTDLLTELGGRRPRVPLVGVACRDPHRPLLALAADE